MVTFSRSPRASYACSTIGASIRLNYAIPRLDTKLGNSLIYLFILLFYSFIIILFFFSNRISPLYEIIVNKDDSYERIANLLIDLKTALKDINELRNEPILLKIQSNRPQT